MIGNVEDTVRDKINDISTAINEHLTQVGTVCAYTNHFYILYIRATFTYGVGIC